MAERANLVFHNDVIGGTSIKLVKRALDAATETHCVIEHRLNHSKEPK